MKKLFQIGNFSFCVIAPEQFDACIPENFLKFKADCVPSYTYTIQVCDTLPEPAGIRTAVREDLQAFMQDGLETRYLGIRGTKTVYGCYRETAPDAAEILIRSEILPELRWDTIFTSLFALEKHMLEYSSLVLHCAYVRDRGKAILFSAPSETGKTTQANLWQQYRGSVTINGDRSLLLEKDGRWYACGWPVCGSSEVCRNEMTPIHAIVMLSQAPENTCGRLSPVRAFAQVYSQLTVNSWDPERANRCMDLLGKLLHSVPVYHLACTISEDAVSCLAGALGV